MSWIKPISSYENRNEERSKRIKTEAMREKQRKEAAEWEKNKKRFESTARRARLRQDSGNREHD